MFQRRRDGGGDWTRSTGTCYRLFFHAELRRRCKSASCNDKLMLSPFRTDELEDPVTAVIHLFNNHSYNPPTMSTLNTANFGSDDEEDQDFVLPPTKPAKKNGQSSKKRTRGSQSPSSSSDSDDSEVDKDDEMKNEAKRLKLEAEEAQALRREKEAEETYKAMLAESTLDHRPKVEAKVEMVEIKRPRQFAGETIL